MRYDFTEKGSATCKYIIVITGKLVVPVDPHSTRNAYIIQI